MNKKREEKVLLLADTMLEAVGHLKQRLAEGKLENNLYLFKDMMEAFLTIEKIIEKREDIDIKAETEDLKKSFEVITSYYEQENYNDIRSFFNFVFLPAFEAWNRQIIKNYGQIH